MNKKLLRSINEMNSEGYYLLDLAVDTCSFKCVKELLDNGADPFNKNKDGLTAIEYAYEMDTSHFDENDIEELQEIKDLFYLVMIYKLKELKYL